MMEIVQPHRTTYLIVSHSPPTCHTVALPQEFYTKRAEEAIRPRRPCAGEQVGRMQEVGDVPDPHLTYVRERQAFGQNLGDFQGVRWVLADMVTEIEATRLLVRRAACWQFPVFPWVACLLGSVTRCNVYTEVTNRYEQAAGAHQPAPGGSGQ